MTRVSKTSLPLALAGAILMAAAVPASAQVATTAVWDPLEQLNRGIYTFNTAFVGVVAAPIINAYRNNVPASVQTGVDNVFTNLREPLTAISSAVQGDLNNTGTSVGRFAINSVAGIGGIFDVATRMGWVSRADDLGNAMCSYGVPAGPYLVLPFVGPSNTREIAGTLVTYGLTYSVWDDGTVAYVVADRVAAAAADMPLPPAETSVVVTPPAGGAKPAPAAPAAAAPSYEEVRANYMGFREQLCADTIPAANLKPSPLGSVIRVN